MTIKELTAPATIKELMAASHGMTKTQREATRCAECGRYYRTHRPTCSLVTIEALLFELEGAKQELSHSHKAWKRCREWISVYQGKCAILRHENNKLRRRLKRQFVKDAAALDSEEIVALIAGLQDVQAGRVREYRARAESNGKETGTND